MRRGKLCKIGLTLKIESMYKLTVLFCLFSYPLFSVAQDERYFRQLFSGSLSEDAQIQKEEEEKKVHYKATTPFYEIDLNDDLRNESLVFERRDGESWFHIHNYPNKKEKIFSYKFDTNGVDAKLYKISIRALSPSIKVLILHFYEGYTKYLEFSGTARYYFLTMENNNFKTLSMYKGPAFWVEKKGFKSDYYRRKYELELYDFNSDGIREVLIKHHLISKILHFQGQGRWIEL